MNRRTLFKILWDQCPVIMVFVVKAHPDLVAPKDMPEIGHGLSMLRFEPPNHGHNWANLNDDEDNLYVTMSFNRQPFDCVIPWRSMAVFGTDNFQVNWNMRPEDEEPSKPPSEPPKLRVVK